MHSCCTVLNIIIVGKTGLKRFCPIAAGFHFFGFHDDFLNTAISFCLPYIIIIIIIIGQQQFLSHSLP
jgi:hypothetical protein